MGLQFTRKETLPPVPPSTERRPMNHFQDGAGTGCGLWIKKEWPPQMACAGKWKHGLNPAVHILAAQILIHTQSRSVGDLSGSIQRALCCFRRLAQLPRTDFPRRRLRFMLRQHIQRTQLAGWACFVVWRLGVLLGLILRVHHQKQPTYCGTSRF